MSAIKNTQLFSIKPDKGGHFHEFMRQSFRAAWDLSGIERKWKGYLPGGTTTSLKRNAWEIFRPHALELKKQESVRSPAALLRTATAEFERYLVDPQRGEFPLETQWELYAELIIQSRCLYLWDRAAGGWERNQVSERDFLDNVLPPLRLCRYCGDIFTQARGYKISFRCNKHACKNAEDRRYMRKRRELQAAGKPAPDIKGY